MASRAANQSNPRSILGAEILHRVSKQVAVEADLGSNAVITTFDHAYLNANGQL